MELITRWNEFCDANSYTEIIYPNEGFDELVKQVYGAEISHTQAVEIAHRYVNGSYSDTCKWWWIDDNGTFGGAYTTANLPIDRSALNAWCKEQGYETPWEEEDDE